METKRQRNHNILNHDGRIIYTLDFLLEFLKTEFKAKNCSINIKEEVIDRELIRTDVIELEYDTITENDLLHIIDNIEYFEKDENKITLMIEDLAVFLSSSFRIDIEPIFDIDFEIINGKNVECIYFFKREVVF